MASAMGVTAETDLRLVESMYWLDAQTVQRVKRTKWWPRIQDIKGVIFCTTGESGDTTSMVLLGNACAEQ